MKKNNIQKIIEQGSLKRKLLVLAEDGARKQFGQSNILDSDEINKIYSEIRSEKEMKILKEFSITNATIQNALVNIQGLMFEIRMHYANLRSFILVWNTLEDTEILVNRVLHEINDHQERNRIIKYATTEFNPFLFTDSSIDNESYLVLNTRIRKESNTPSLIDMINYNNKNVLEALIKFISWKKALLDFMKETDFFVQAYKERLELFTEEINNSVLIKDKYKSNVPAFVEENSKRINRLKSHYSLVTSLDEVAVDPNIYNWFKKEILENGQKN
jgi:hypothetical protein